MSPLKWSFVSEGDAMHRPYNPWAGNQSWWREGPVCLWWPQGQALGREEDWGGLGVCVCVCVCVTVCVCHQVYVW